MARCASVGDAAAQSAFPRLPPCCERLPWRRRSQFGGLLGSLFGPGGSHVLVLAPSPVWFRVERLAAGAALPVGKDVLGAEGWPSVAFFDCFGWRLDALVSGGPLRFFVHLFGGGEMGLEWFGAVSWEICSLLSPLTTEMMEGSVSRLGGGLRCFGAMAGVGGSEWTEVTEGVCTEDV